MTTITTSDPAHAPDTAPGTPAGRLGLVAAVATAAAGGLLYLALILSPGEGQPLPDTHDDGTAVESAAAP